MCTLCCLAVRNGDLNAIEDIGNALSQAIILKFSNGQVICQTLGKIAVVDRDVAISRFADPVFRDNQQEEYLVSRLLRLKSGFVLIETNS